MILAIDFIRVGTKVRRAVLLSKRTALHLRAAHRLLVIPSKASEGWQWAKCQSLKLTIHAD